MSVPNPRLTAAHHCARHYLAVFLVWWTMRGVCQCPLGRRCTSPGKHPIPRGWQDEATIKPDVIDGWWGRWPDANLGIACGPSGILVLDIDPRHNGDETLRDLIEQHGPLPATVETITGGGGRHIFLASPGGISNHSPFPGIDVRGDGGFIVAPGSIHVSGGTYEWEASCHPDWMPIAPAPPWLIATLRQPPLTHPRAAPVPERIPEGGRYRALLSMAGTLRNRGATADEMYGCLIVFNQSRCDPSLDDAELRRIADSVARYDPGTPDRAAVGNAIHLERTRVRL